MKHEHEGVRFTLPVLRDRNGDLSKRWYVEYYAWNQEKAQRKRQVRYCPLRYKTLRERKAWAKLEIAELTSLLIQGYYQVATKPTPPPTPPAPKVETNRSGFDPSDNILTVLERLVELRKRAFANRTNTSYANAFYRFREFCQATEQNLTLSNLSRRHAYEFSDFIVAIKGNSNLYRNNLIQSIHTLLNDLVDREILANNPFRGIKNLPEAITRKNIAYTAEQQQVLEAYLLDNNPYLFACTRFIYQAFIRPIEVMKLQIRDIDLPGRRIGVHGSIAKTTHEHKTDYVQITSSLADIIHEMKLHLYSPTEYVFSEAFRPGQAAKHRNMFTTHHSNALRATDLYNGELTGYSWKHTGVTNAFNKGAKLEWLQRQCRHANLEQTVTYLKSLGLMLPIDYDAPPF